MVLKPNQMALTSDSQCVSLDVDGVEKLEPKSMAQTTQGKLYVVADSGL